MDRRHTLLGLALALAACTPVPAPSPVATVSLLPLPSATVPAAAPARETPSPATTPVIIASPTATSTPVTHVVTTGETMLGIAIDFGVSLDALQAANPTIQARFLSIGTVLVIPPPEGGFAVAATNLAPPPPAPVQFSQPACYPLASDGLYCLVAARNPNTVTVANISARIILAGPDGLPFASQNAFGALDLVPAGSAMPLAALFEPAPAHPAAATGVEALTAILVTDPLSETNSVLLDVNAAPGAVVNGRWSVTGQVRNPTPGPLSTAWVVLSVNDASGRLIGFRKLALANGLAAGETRDFSIDSDALAGLPASGNVLAEGQP